MSINPKVKNPLIMTLVSTVILIPVLILTHFLFREFTVNPWLVLAANVVIYFILIFLVFLYYGNIGRK